jgi:hypothetical protein
VGLAAVIILAVAVLAATALAGAKAPDKEWEMGHIGLRRSRPSGAVRFGRRDGDFFYASAA